MWLDIIDFFIYLDTYLYEPFINQRAYMDMRAFNVLITLNIECHIYDIQKAWGAIKN